MQPPAETSPSPRPRPAQGVGHSVQSSDPGHLAGAVWPALLWLVALACWIPEAAGQAPELVSLKVGSRQVEGRVLAVDHQTLVLLRREGSMNFIPRERITDFVSTGQRFSPQDRERMQAALREEFGRDYAVSRTQHFLVVHPHGDAQRWARPFEELFQRFVHYFSSRGYSLDEPEFPLVAVVLETRGEFDRFLARHQTPDPMVLGYYAPRSNRIITCRASLEKSDLTTGLSTLVHEAAHQTAFNTGIHTRFSACPLWISEGLATMFEARGVNNSAWYGQQSDRIHPVRLRIYREALAGGSLPALHELVQGDAVFRSDPDRAYATAWALTFFLAETRPREYFQYLRHTAAHTGFEDYPPADRLQDFALHFGRDLNDLDLRLRQYIQKLPAE